MKTILAAYLKFCNKVFLCFFYYSNQVDKESENCLFMSPRYILRISFYVRYIFWAAITKELCKISNSNFQQSLVLWRPQNRWNVKVLGTQVLKSAFSRYALLWLIFLFQSYDKSDQFHFNGNEVPDYRILLVHSLCTQENSKLNTE